MGNSSSVPENWSKGKLIGEGGFGKVYKVKANGKDTELAVKIVHGFEKHIELLNSEIEVLQSLEHERILSLLGHERRGSSYCLFFPYMSEGSLSSYIERKRRLKEHEVRPFTKEILEGLCYLHDEGIIHRDLKGDNVLLDEHLYVKLADFGLSKLLDQPSVYSTTSYQGTPNFMAPELWKSGKHTFTVDIWALGCTVVQMISGQPPFLSKGVNTIKGNVRSGGIPDYRLPGRSSPALRDLLEQTFEYNPRDRPSSRQLMKHPFVKN